MPGKCVHKGCGKTFADDSEPCVYHPGPPVFHEGQKGWDCCKPRVLTFDEFLTIPPCKTGIHSTIDDTPVAPKKPTVEAPTPTPTPSAPVSAADIPRLPTAQPPPKPASAPAPPENETDDPNTPIPANATCKRKACGTTYTGGSRDGETCTHHPGAPVFHEGSKGWSCCKRRVLEFDEFLRIPGCVTKPSHLFVGAKKDAKEQEKEEVLQDIRTDFYQTPTAVMASLYLKKIDASASTVEFGTQEVRLDLKTTDKKRYTAEWGLWGEVVSEKCEFKVLGTKLELVLGKKDGLGWPVLRGDDRHTGEIIQMGKAGRA